MCNCNYFKVGGSLRYQHPTYIERQADRDIYNALIQREFDYGCGSTCLKVRVVTVSGGVSTVVCHYPDGSTAGLSGSVCP